MADLERGRILDDARNVHRAWFSLSADAAGGETAHIRGVHVIYEPSERATVTLAFPGIPAAHVGGALDDVVDYCQERRAHTVGCWIGGRPSRALGAGLLARGFEWGWEPHWMGLDLSDLVAPRIPTGISFAIDPQDAVWDDHAHPYFGTAEPERARAQAGLLSAAVKASGGRLRHVLAWLDDRPVGAAVILRVGSVAGVFNVGVPPDARHRGIGTAVTYEALRIARAEGCVRAVLNATPLGEPVYRKLGFQSGGQGQTLWMHHHAIRRLPFDRAQVAFIEAIGRDDPAALDLAAQAIEREQLDAPTPSGLRPIDVAVALRSLRSARWLVKRGATLDVSAACDLGWRAEVPRMLHERPELVDLQTGPEGATALHRAAASGDAELVGWLLDAGADRAIEDRVYHATAAGWARHFGHTRIAELIESRSFPAMPKGLPG